MTNLFLPIIMIQIFIRNAQHACLNRLVYGVISFRLEIRNSRGVFELHFYNYEIIELFEPQRVKS